MTIRRLLVFCLVCLNSLPVLADTEELYRFERLWPVLQQPWYFNKVTNIAVDKQGNVYVADTFNRQLKKLTSDGHLIYQRTVNTDSSRLPYQIAVNSHEHVYVLSRKRQTDQLQDDLNQVQNYFIQVFDAHGDLIKDWGENPQLFGQMGLSDLAIDSQDNVYLAQSYYTRVIKKFSSEGELLEEWPVVPLKEKIPSEEQLRIAIDNRDEFIYLSDQGNHQVLKYTAEGELVKQWGKLGNEPGQFRFPESIAVDSDNNVYVADTKNNRIQKFTQDGEFVKLWGNEDNLNAAKWRKILNEPPLGEFFKFITLPELSGFIKDIIPSQNDEFIADFNANPLLLFSLLNSETFLPEAIAVGPKNQVYIAYNLPDLSIRKYTSEGQFITQWASRGTTDNQLNIALAIAKDSQGSIYMTDLLNHRVVKTTAEGQFVTSWGELGKGEGQFIFPYGIAIDSKDNVYVVDTGNFRIQKFSSTGEFIEQWGGFDGPLQEIIHDILKTFNESDSKNLSFFELFMLANRFDKILDERNCPDNHCFFVATHIAIDKRDNVYVVDSFRNRVNKFTSDGQFIKAFGKRGDNDGEFNLPMGITVDNDHVYVADLSKHQVQKFTTNGEWLERWGECVLKKVEGVSSEVVPTSQDTVCMPGAKHPEGTECQCTFQSPYDVATDEEGNVYVSDAEHERIQKLTPEGQLVTQWGDLGTNPGQFNQPGGLTVSPDGNKVYVTDLNNNRVQVFNRTLYDPGKVVIVAGRRSQKDQLWNETQMVANFAYRALTYQGFTKDSIYYLSADIDLDLDNNGKADDVDAKPTWENLKYAITEWAKGTDNLTVYLTDHGGSEKFQLNENTELTATELNDWLNTLQADMTGSLKIIYDACLSGSFLPRFVPPDGKNRVVITSSSADQNAYFHSQGSLSFSSLFWNHVFYGSDLANAFSQTFEAIDYLKALQTQQKQTPQLEANGNGVANEAADQAQVTGVYIGNGTKYHANAPVIESVSISPSQTLIKTKTATIKAQVSDDQGIARVWVVIRSPADLARMVTGEPITALESFDLAVEDQHYQGQYHNFTEEGTYQLAIYARDREGHTALPHTLTVRVENPFKRKAIIIAGDLPTPIQNTGPVYDALRYQGYQDDNIYWLSNTSQAGVDVLATLDNVKFAITTWANENTQNLVIYLEGWGDETALELSETERLRFEKLDSWLDTLQQQFNGAVTVIYDGPYSSYIVPALASPNNQRIVISSTGKTESSCLNQETLELFFSQNFWQTVRKGTQTVYEAFKEAKRFAKETIKARYPNLPLEQRERLYPQLDGNGNGISNEDEDREIAKQQRIGIGVITADIEPLIGTVSPKQTLNGARTATLWVEQVTTTGRLSKIVATISPPCDTGESVTSVELKPLDNGRYQAEYAGFLSQGTYKIAIYAEDQTRRRSLPMRTYVHQTQPVTIYHTGEPAQLSFPTPPSGNYDHYLGILLPDNQLWAIKGLNEFIPFDINSIPSWAGQGEKAIDVEVTASIPRGEYRFYWVRLPKGTPLLLPPAPETLGESVFYVGD
jgi:DNA-binding beta-propeller fold protein YncE